MQQIRKIFQIVISIESLSYPEIILEICKSIPKDEINLEELQFSKTSTQKIMFRISGRIREESSYSPADFMLALERTGYFLDLSLATTTMPLERLEDEETTFLIRGEVVGI